jgi:hypothetical protein
MYVQMNVCIYVHMYVGLEMQATEKEASYTYSELCSDTCLHDINVCVKFLTADHTVLKRRDTC